MVGTAVTVDALDAEGRFLGGHPAGLRPDAARARDGHRRSEGADRRGGRFPTNTSDALMSGGSDAIAGAIERMHKMLAHTGERPALIMTGGAAVKLASIPDLPFETVDTLIFDGFVEPAGPTPGRF